MAAVSTGDSRGGRRLPGVDLARAVAVIGMVMVHFRASAPAETVGLTETVYSLSRGRASLLFAVLAAVGITLAAGAAARRPEARGLGTALVTRGLILIPPGAGPAAAPPRDPDHRSGLDAGRPGPVFAAAGATSRLVRGAGAVG